LAAGYRRLPAKHAHTIIRTGARGGKRQRRQKEKGGKKAAKGGKRR